MRTQGCLPEVRKISPVPASSVLLIALTLSVIFAAGTTAQEQSVSAIPGDISTFAGGGSPPGPPPTFVGDGELATAARLAGPTGVAYDLMGNAFIADTGHNRIRRVDHVTGRISTIAGNGLAGWSEDLAYYPSVADGEGGPATDARLRELHGIDVDREGNVYFTTGIRVRKVSADGIITTIAGNGLRSDTGDGGPASEAALNKPAAVSVDRRGNVYIADTENYAIRKVDATTGNIDRFAFRKHPTGSRGFTGDGGAAMDAKAKRVLGIDADDLGNVWIADPENDRVRMIDATGIIRTVAGSTFSPGEPRVYTGDGGLATEARLPNPYGVLGDGLGGVFVTDSEAHRVLRVSAAGRIDLVAGNGTAGDTGDDLPAIQAPLNAPSSLAERSDLYGRYLLITTPAGKGLVRKLVIEGPRDPIVSGLAPQIGPITGGTATTITGTDLDQASVAFDGANATDVNSSSPSILTARTPAGNRLGPVPVLVTRGPRQASAPDFTFVPAIRSISPPSGRLEGNEAMTIYGKGFTGATKVTFEGVGSIDISPAQSDAEIHIETLPHDTPESVHVSVTVGSYISMPVEVGSDIFVYRNPLVRTSDGTRSGAVVQPSGEGANTTPPIPAGPGSAPGGAPTSSLSSAPTSSLGSAPVGLSSSAGNLVPTSASAGSISGETSAVSAFSSSGAQGGFGSANAVGNNVPEVSMQRGAMPTWSVSQDPEAAVETRQLMVGRSASSPIRALVIGAEILMVGACFAFGATGVREGRKPEFRPQRA